VIRLPPDADIDAVADAAGDMVLADAARMIIRALEDGAGIIVSDIYADPAASVPRYAVADVEGRPGGEVILGYVDVEGVADQDWGDGAVEIVIRRPTLPLEPRLVLDFADPAHRAKMGR
jgi:hypothetical protein